MVHMLELSRRQTACEAILRDVGKVARARFLARDFEAGSKGAQDLVSDVDRATERAICTALSDKFPTDNFLGEEHGGTLGDRTWIIDPIDGTSNFVRGTAYWCLSVALVSEGRAVIGVIYDPMADELFSCRAGAGATLNGAPISVSQTASPQEATLGISFNFQNSYEGVPRLTGDLIAEGTSFRMLGAGALSLAHCAAGRTDGFFEAFMKPWDAAAGLALIAEAGGAVCDYGANGGYATGNPVLGCTPGLADYFAKMTGVDLGSKSAP